MNEGTRKANAGVVIEPPPIDTEHSNGSVPEEEAQAPKSLEEQNSAKRYTNMGAVTVVENVEGVAAKPRDDGMLPVKDEQSDETTPKAPLPPPSETADPDGDWIDRTNQPLGRIGNGYTLTPTLTSLYLTNNRIKQMENLEACKQLRELVLRQNAIETVEGLECLGELVELDLYMNQIEDIPPTAFKANPNLKKLDLSFNQLRTLDAFPCANLPNLEELFLIGNKIKAIASLRDMPKLVMLELGDNRIRDLENLEHLVSLEGLWLGRNKLTNIQNLDALVNLRRLSLQSNRLTVVEGISHLQHLEELYLSHNGISSMHGVESLTNLRVLDFGENFIEHIEGVERLVNLKEFWINGNKLHSFEELELLAHASGLETVYLEGNPLAADPDYKRKALQKLPASLEQLDALLVEDVRKLLSERDNTMQVDEVVPHFREANEKEGGTLT